MMAKKSLLSKDWLNIALFNLLIAISIGAVLRYAFVEEIKWLEFKNFLHAHSHVAMLGWVYLALGALLVHSFVVLTKRQSIIYSVLFWLTQGSVLGMLLAFPIYGYSFWPILFSTLHVFLSYIFVGLFLKDVKKNNAVSTTSIRFIKTALFFMVLSTLALWAMAPIIQLGGHGSGWYHMAIQFYLHFQFNGWFVFGVLGLFFKILENAQLPVVEKDQNRFYWLLVLSCFLTYALAITWANPEEFIFWVNSLGVLLQLMALFYFFKVIRPLQAAFKNILSDAVLLLIKISGISFFAKVLIQTAVLVPYIATVAYTVRNFAIGFIHLMLLGMITHFIFGYGTYQQLFNLKSALSRLGLRLFTLGFLLSEILLFLQGFLLWQAMGFLPFYYEIIFLFSVLMPIGIGMFYIGQLWSREVLT